MEEVEQEIAIERMKLVCAILLLHHVKAVAQVVRIAIERIIALCIEEALALNEIDKHQAVQHHRGIPGALLVLLLVQLMDTCNKVLKNGMLFLKAVVETFRHLLDIERLLHASSNIEMRQAQLFL